MVEEGGCNGKKIKDRKGEVEVVEGGGENVLEEDGLGH